MALTKTGLTFAKTTDGGPPDILSWPLSGATTYYRGEVLRVSNTSGSAIQAIAGGTSIAFVCPDNVTAAQATAAGAAGLPLYMMTDRMIFEAIVPYSVAPAGLRGQAVGLKIGTVHNYRLRATAAATAPNVILIIKEKPGESTAAHASGVYWVKAAKSIWASIQVSSASP